MTTYGTIQTEPSSSSTTTMQNLRYLSRAKERIKEGLATRKPWKQMFNFTSFNFPSNIHEATIRLKTNISFFRANYTITVLIILFLSLLWHPISLIVFLVMGVAWLYFYFLRDEPLVVFNRTIDDRVVLVVLSVLTIVFLLLTRVTWNVVVSILIGGALVVLHGVLRKIDDLFPDDEATGLMS